MADRLIISVKEARKLLGKDAESLTDKYIEELIVQLDEIARLTIRQFMERNREAETQKN